MPKEKQIVIPAKAGIHWGRLRGWILAEFTLSEANVAQHDMLRLLRLPTPSGCTRNDRGGL